MLQRSWYDPKNRTMQVLRLKRRDRFIKELPMSLDAIDSLDAYLKTRKNGREALFVVKGGRLGRGYRAIGWRTVGICFKEAWELSGVTVEARKGVYKIPSFHILRHSALTRMAIKMIEKERKVHEVRISFFTCGNSVAVFTRTKGFIPLSLVLISLLIASPTVAYVRGSPPGKGEEVTPTQNLIESPDGGAAVWDHASIAVLINPNVYSPDSPEVSAGGRAIDHWKASIAWFSVQDWNGDGASDYPWLDQLDFIIYVQGVNATLLASPADVTITYYYKIAPGFILGYASLSFKQVGEHYAIQSVDIVLGVKGLSTIGIENLVAHEFGHALGLGHSNKKGDLMYSSFDMSEEKKSIVSPSTLNLYALAISHGWLPVGAFSEYHGSLAITLPANIPYKKSP